MDYIGLLLYRNHSQNLEYLLVEDQGHMRILHAVPSDDNDHTKSLLDKLNSLTGKQFIGVDGAPAELDIEFQFKLTVDSAVTFYQVGKFTGAVVEERRSKCQWYDVEQACAILNVSEQELLRTVHGHVQELATQDDGSETTIESNIHNRLYKTKMCRSYEAEGFCRYGDKCLFAHGESELNVVSLVQKSLPVVPEVKQQELKVNSKYKTRLCEKWLTNGHCPYKTKCVFAHGQSELRQSAPQITTQKPEGLNAAPLSEAGNVDTEIQASSQKLDYKTVVQQQAKKETVDQENDPALSPILSHSGPSANSLESAISLDREFGSEPIAIQAKPEKSVSKSSFSGSLFDSLWSNAAPQVKKSVPQPPGLNITPSYNVYVPPNRKGLMSQQLKQAEPNLSVQTKSLQSVVESLIVSKEDNIPVITSIVESVSNPLSRDKRHQVLVSSILQGSHDDCVTLRQTGIDSLVSSPITYLRSARYIMRALVCGSLTSQFAFLLALDEFVECHWVYGPYVNKYAPVLFNYLLSGDDFPPFNIEIVLIWFAQYQPKQDTSKLRPALHNSVDVVSKFQAIGF